MKTLRILFLTLTLGFLMGGTFASTFISAGSEVSGRWTKSGSPYLINGEAVVPFGKTLEIEPGTVVRFKTGESRDYPDTDMGFLRVEGKLIANGKEGELIHFTREGDEGYWGVIYINGAGSEFSFCNFEYGYYVRGIGHNDNATAVLTAYSCNVSVKNCLFAINGWTALNAKGGATINASNCGILVNKYGAESNTASTINLQKCQLFENETTFYCNGEGIINLSGSGLDIASEEEACVIEKKGVKWSQNFEKAAFKKLKVFTAEELEQLEEATR